MAAIYLCKDKSSNGLGTSFTNSGELSIYALVLTGELAGATVSVLVSLDGTDWATAGVLTKIQPAKLIMLPAGAICNIEIFGADSEASRITVQAAS